MEKTNCSLWKQEDWELLTILFWKALSFCALIDNVSRQQLSTSTQVTPPWKDRGEERWDEFVFTCLGQPQLCVHVIKHFHRELEPAGEKLIPLLDWKGRPLKLRPCEMTQQSGMSVYFINKCRWQQYKTEENKDLRLQRHLKVPLILWDSHIINVCSCSALQPFIWDLQVCWDICMLQWGAVLWDFSSRCNANVVELSIHIKCM